MKNKNQQPATKKSANFISGTNSERSTNSTDAPLNFLNKLVNSGEGTFRLPKSTNPESYKFAMSGVVKSALLNE